MLSLRGRYMEVLPAEVQQCYSFVLFTTGGASNALLEKTVIGMQSSSAMHRETQEVGMRNCVLT